MDVDVEVDVGLLLLLLLIFVVEAGLEVELEEVEVEVEVEVNIDGVWEVEREVKEEDFRRAGLGRTIGVWRGISGRREGGSIFLIIMIERYMSFASSIPSIYIYIYIYIES